MRSIADVMAGVAPSEAGCWLWLGRIDADGYGRCRFNGSDALVHRVVMEIQGGPIPKGLHVDHLCRIRACCNPAHLEVVTPAVNAARAAPFHYLGTRQACIRGHEFTPANTYDRPGSGRQCRACQRAAVAKYKARKRASA